MGRLGAVELGLQGALRRIRARHLGSMRDGKLFTDPVELILMGSSKGQVRDRVRVSRFGLGTGLRLELAAWSSLICRAAPSWVVVAYEACTAATSSRWFKSAT